MSFPVSLSLFVAGILAVTTTLALADPATTPPPAPTTPTAVAPVLPKPKPVRPPPPLLYRDTTEYPPLTLTWNTDTDVSQVLGVFTHPALPRRALVTTQQGVLLTDDAGRTWTHPPGATADKVGVINAIAFHPVALDTFYLGSATGGIWMTTDLGKTFTHVGGKAQGMASDAVTDLIVYPGDASHQTLLAVHGDAAPGLSCSHDGGKTWSVVNTDYHFRRLIGAEGDSPEIYLTGSAATEPDIQSLYTCSSVGELVVEVVRDVVPTDLATAPLPFHKNGALYLATSDSGLYRVDMASQGGDENAPVQIGSKDDSWASVNVNWGPSADAQNLYLYDPAKKGLVISGDDLATEQTASDGLTVGPLIKAGAVIRPNANGTVFYASANGSLSIGRPADDVPEVEVTPPIYITAPRPEDDWRGLQSAFQAFNNAKGSTLAAAQALGQKVGDLDALYHQHEITVTARLPLKPAPPTSVTVDMSRYGGPPDVPLFDDGAHDDGAAGDGVYGGTFAFWPELHRPREWAHDVETRSIWPGRVALGVQATYADGHHQGAVGVVDIYSAISDMKYWGNDPKSIAVKAQGAATAQSALNPPEIHRGGGALRIDTQSGSWSVTVNAPWDKWDITGYAAYSFWIRLSDGTAPKELYMQLTDSPELSAPTTTERVPILEGKSLGTDYIQIVIPLSRLIPPASPFQSKRAYQIIFSGDATAPATLYLDGLQVLARYDGPDPAAAPTPAPSSQ